MHHVVNYKPFETNKLIRKSELNIPEGINDYGMVLKRRTNERKDNQYNSDSGHGCYS